jgi:phospholipase/carboxylesterase/glyoxalase family protein
MNTTALATYVHRYVAPKPGDEDSRTLLLLHGTGGSEDALLPLGEMLAPGAGFLSPRGNVSEQGAARFFRRITEGVFDMDDLHARTKDLAAFVAAAAEAYAFDPAQVIAVGFSNGANIAGSLLLSFPRILSAAVLFRPMVPFVPAAPVSLMNHRVFIGAGDSDPLVARGQPERLAELFRQFGAEVTLERQPAGHALTRADVAAAYDWLEAARSAE